MFAEPPAEAKAAPLTAAQLQAGRPARGAAAAAAAPQKMPTVKLVDLGMACLYDPAKPITGGGVVLVCVWVGDWVGSGGGWGVGGGGGRGEG